MNSRNPKSAFGIGDNSSPISTNKSKKQSTFDMFDINVKGAQKQTKDVFDYAKNEVSDFGKFQVKTTSSTMKTVADITVTTYGRIYKQLETMHTTYLSGVVAREAEAAKKVAENWANSRSSNSSSNKQIVGSNGQPISSSSQSTNKSSGTNYSQDIGKFMKSLDSSLSNKNNNFSSHLEKQISKMSSGVSDAAGDGTTKGMSKGANILLSVGKEILKLAEMYMQIWLKRFKDGIDKIYNTYESTYTGVSVLMNQNQDQYMSWQTQARDSLRTLSLDNNIAISSVMEQLDATTKMGISGQKAQNKALADTISKTIAPFVDTTTDAYTDLQFKLGDSFVTSMNGMSESIREQTGSARFISKNINSILEQLEPIAMSAKNEQFAQQFGEMAAMFDAAVAEGSLTMSQANTMKDQITNIVNDPHAAITGNDIIQRQVVASGIDTTDPAAVAAAILEQNAYWSEQASASGSRIAAGAMGDALTGSSAYLTGLSDMGFNRESAYEAIRSGRSIDDVYGTGKDMLSSFAGDQYTTSTAQKDIWAENSALEASQFKQRYPDAYELLSTLVSDVGKILVALVGGKLISKLLGGGGGPGSLIPSLVGAAPGAAVATAGLAATGAGLYYGSDAAHRSSTASSSEKGALAAQGIGAGMAVAGGATATVAGGIGVAAGLGAAAGGATAMGAAAAGLAAIPVFGWVALGVAALGVGIAATANHFSKLDKGINKINESYDASKESLDQEREARAQQIEALKDEYASTETTEDKRKLLIKQGIVKEEEASHMTSAAIDQAMNSYTDMAESIENGGLSFAEKASNWFDWFDTQPDSIGDAVFRALQKRDKEQLEKDKETASTDFANALSSMSEEAAAEQIRNMGFENSISKGWFKGNYSAEELAKIAKEDPSEFSRLINSNQGVFGWNGSAMDELEQDDINTIYNNLGIDKHIATADEQAESAKQIMKSLDTLYGVIRSGGEPTGDNLTKYREARDYMLKESTIERLSGLDSVSYYGASLSTFDKNKIESTFPRYAAGNSYVASDQLAYLHQGEAVLTKAQNKQYRTVASSIPFLSKLFGGGLFSAMSGTPVSNDQTASTSDVIAAMNDGINRLIEAILSLNRDPNQQIADTSNNMLSRIARPSYDSNLVTLSPSIATSAK